MRWRSANTPALKLIHRWNTICRLRDWGTVWPLKGALKDISLKGFYFTCQDRLWMDVGDILHFNIDISPIRAGSQDLNYLGVQGMVVRIEYLGPGSDPCGVGVQLLEPLELFL